MCLKFASTDLQIHTEFVYRYKNRDISVNNYSISLEWVHII